MIEGMVGRPGSGKTYSLTARALHAADSGRQVFSNYPIRHPNVTLFAPEDLLWLPSGLIVIDEAHVWFPARQSLRLPIEWLTGLSQTRKNGWDLYWSAQHEMRVDRVIRDVTNWMHLCEAWLSWDGHPVFFRTRCWEPERFRDPDPRTRGPSWFGLFSRRVAESYNTLGKIVEASHTRRKDGSTQYERPADFLGNVDQVPEVKTAPSAQKFSGAPQVNGSQSAVTP